jgi:2-dehydropantoate 2-reductase
MMQQILMVGAGSVGGYFGAHLAKANLSVSFLLRTKTLAAVKQNGLTIRSANGSFTVHPPTDSDPRALPKPDLIILSVKAYDLDEVLTQIEPVLTDKTDIMTIQNGIDTEDRNLASYKRD